MVLVAVGMFLVGGLTMVALARLPRPTRWVPWLGVGVGAMFFAYGTWMWWRMSSSFAAVDPDGLGLLWVFGLPLAAYGVPATMALLASAVALRHRGATLALAVALCAVALVGAGGKAMLTHATWGMYWLPSPVDGALWRYLISVPALSFACVGAALAGPWDEPVPDEEDPSAP